MVKVLLDDFGYKAVSRHRPLEELENNLNQVIEDQKIVGSSFVVCPYIMPERQSKEDYIALISFLNQTGEILRRDGITLCYHNHDFELQRLSDGRTVLEAIYEGTNSENVKAEFDIYWLTKAGEVPAKWISCYQNRTSLIHLKDMTTDEEQFFAELGTGGVDIQSVLKKGEEAGVQWWIIE